MDWGRSGRAFLAGRPGEVASAEKVDVKMGNRFAAVGAVVDDESVACGGYVFAAGDFGGDEKKVAE